MMLFFCTKRFVFLAFLFYCLHISTHDALAFSIEYSRTLSVADPVAVAFDENDNIYVTSRSNNVVYKYDSSFSQILTMGQGYLDYPNGLTVCDGRLFVTSTGSGKIEIFELNGSHFLSAGEGSLADPYGLTTYGNMVYFTEWGDNIVTRYNMSYYPDQVSKVLDLQFGSAGGKASTVETFVEYTEFNGPYAITCHSDKIYVTDDHSHKVRVFSSGGNHIGSFGSYGTGDGQFNEPEGVAVDSAGNIYVSDNDNDRIQVFNADFSFLYKMGTQGSGSTSFNDPRQITIHDDKLYVADRGNNRVQIFDIDTTPTDEKPFSLAAINLLLSEDEDAYKGLVFDRSWYTVLNDSKGIEITADGSVYVADWDGGRVSKWDKDEAYKGGFGNWGEDLGEFKGAFYLTSTPDGSTLYITDDENCRIQKCSSTGDCDLAIPAYCYSSGIDMDAEGNLWTVSYGGPSYPVQRYSATGSRLTQWGSTGSGAEQVQDPHGLKIGPAGNIWIADSANNRIQKFSPTGELLMSFGSSGSGDGQFNGPRDLAFDSKGNIYVTDRYNHRIQVFSNKGVFLDSLGGIGTENGQFNNPYGIAVGSNDEVFVVDSYNNRIQVFRQK